MTETTPGPLIKVLQFVVFMVTFAPWFAWIFLGAPFMERLRSNTALSAVLSAVPAAVVGMILNLAL